MTDMKSHNKEEKDKTCMKMCGPLNKYSENYPMTGLYKMFGRSNKYSLYYPMTDL